MAEQTELDLPDPVPQPTRRAKRAIFGGFTRLQMLMGLMVLAALVWGMWVTKLLVTPTQDHIVSARLSTIVGEYVQAQAQMQRAFRQHGSMQTVLERVRTDMAVLQQRQEQKHTDELAGQAWQRQLRPTGRPRCG